MNVVCVPLFPMAKAVGKSCERIGTCLTAECVWCKVYSHTLAYPQSKQFLNFTFVTVPPVSMFRQYRFSTHFTVSLMLPPHLSQVVEQTLASSRANTNMSI